MSKNDNEGVELIPGEENPELPPDDSLGSQIRELLAEGHTGKEIIEMGYAESTVRQEARRWAKKNGNPTNGKPTASLTIKEKEQVIPEWLEGQVAELMDGSVANQKAFIAGMAIPLLGMRMWAEGCKPMLALMQTYQQGQTEAAKAAQGGADDVAEKTVVAALPYMERMVKESSRASSPNPMAAMFSRILEGPMTQAMSGIFNMFGMPQAGGQSQQGQGQPTQSPLPPGWSYSLKEGEQK